MYEECDRNYLIVTGKQGKYRGKSVCDNIFCFDIEDTSYYLDENNIPHTFNYDKPELSNSYRKGSLCYHWQFSIDETVITGRELTDFVKLLEVLNKYCPAYKIIYVHFLSHEFQFLLNILKFDNVFARTAHKPLTATIEKYNVEFRCSFMLTRLSLDSWSKKLPIKKLKGNLDYDILRTPLTRLTQKEKDYCVNDVLVMYHGIKAFRDKYEHIYNIPLTQTGEVRRVVKNKLSKNSNWLKQCRSLLPSTLDNFKEMLNAFIGGTVISNILYKDTSVGNVKMFDIASSYPWAMISERYPMKPFTEVETDELEYYRNNYLFAFLITFTVYDVESITNCKFLSKSKCTNLKNEECDNGRIIRSTELTVTLTNIDYEIFLKTYSFSKMDVHTLKVSGTRYLPDEFRRYVIELFNSKTTLKGVANMEDLYMESKQFINSLFGMMVTKEFSDDIIFDGDEWEKDVLTEDRFFEKLAVKQRSLSKNFLSFQFGVWVTAYARNNLWKAILELDKYVVYCDTDSVKYINEEPTDFFDRYNQKVLNTHQVIADQLHIDANLLSPVSPSGKKCYIGIYECENPNNLPINEFKALGAKKYCYRDPTDGELHMTVSGVSKKAVKCLNNDISNFEDGTIFTEKMLKEADASKLTPYYLSDNVECTFPDGYVNKYKYGICLMPTTYKIGISPSDLLLLAMIFNNKTELLEVRSTELERNNEDEILQD